MSIIEEGKLVTPPLDLTYEVEILINLQLKGIEFVFIFVVSYDPRMINYFVCQIKKTTTGASESLVGLTNFFQIGF